VPLHAGPCLHADGFVLYRIGVASKQQTAEELNKQPMPAMRRKIDPKSNAEFLAGVKRDQANREQGYRDQALKLFPHVCAKCGREFSGKRLRELTVHHKDNDHMNNPPDGSNWELLCLYCHDDEHEAYERAGYYSGSVSSGAQDSGYTPFAGLKDLLKPSEDPPDAEKHK